MELLLVMVAGAIGVAARYGISHTWPLDPAAGFPWATFGVNLVGALLIGVLMAWTRSGHVDRTTWLPILGVGLLGGFTTFSTFAFDAVALADAGRMSTAAIYVVTTNVVGIALAAGAFAAVRAAA